MPLVFPYVIGNEEQVRLGHLLRRAGFGASAQEMKEYRKLGLDSTIDYLIEYEKVDDSALEERLQGMELDLEDRPRNLQQWWLLRMVYTRRPLQEKMTLFWHGLLTSAFRKVGKGPWMLQQNQLLRKHALGTYDVLLKAISRDPAMLIWLDSRRNRKGAPNENYARELMELFSMGVGTPSASWTFGRPPGPSPAGLSTRAVSFSALSSTTSASRAFWGAPATSTATTSWTSSWSSPSRPSI